MDSFEGASSEDAPELNAGLVVAAATDDKGPSSVGAALTEGATNEGSTATANVALTTSAGQCKRQHLQPTQSESVGSNLVNSSTLDW
ncbi:hypothetical protein C0989_006575 [Termitomyces sp. Mn162]|nr:hypothetical protein C0989_006575 [Termitomyces sp. Mn162]